MTTGTHQVVSLSVTLLASPGKSERITMVDCTLRHTCQCGVISEYIWKSVPVSSGLLGDLATGLIAEVSAVAGRAELLLHSLVYSSDSPTS